MTKERVQNMKMTKFKLMLYTMVIILMTNILTVRYQLSDYVESNPNGKDMLNLMELKNVVEDEFYTDIDEEELIVGMKKGLFQGLNDPYSEFYTKEEMNELKEQTTGELIGIGVIVGIKDDNIVVISPIKDSPAMRVGLKAGDIISKVNGKEYKANELSDAVKEIKVPLSEKKSSLLGKVDYGKVKIEVLREGKEREFEIQREEISLQTVEYKQLENKIGYIAISQFADGTAKDFVKELETSKKNDDRALIIDLRNNPGGLLNEVQDVADSIMGEATIVYTQDRNGKKQYIKSRDGGGLNIPLVVLINEGSASASEVLSGAVRDNEIGTLVGEKTFGKALVQTVRQLSDGSGFKLTVQQYFTPRGENINHKGIVPDVEVKLDENQLLKNQVDTQLQKAIEIIQTKLNQK